jgi:hypothetical protein
VPAIVNAGVVVPVATLTIPPVQPTLVTVPATELAIFTKSDPFQATVAFSFTAKVTPVVGPVPQILTVYVLDELITK